MAMAEARREDGSEWERRDLRDMGIRGPATDCAEKAKAERLHSSQGPLSSIRAAIKRKKANSQCEHIRERRRPDITIVSAEPLASNSWFPGRCVVFPPSPQSDWPAGIQAVSQHPPPYDQVIQEKTRGEEHVVRPTAAPRRASCTATSSTQTDTVGEGTTTAVLPRSAEKERSAGKKPEKPPRPSLPKPAVIKPGTVPDRKVGTNPTASTSTEIQIGSQSDITSEKTGQADPTGSVTINWNIPANHLPAPADTTPTSSTSEPCQRPIPLPRRKTQKRATAEEVLVRLNDHCDADQSDSEDGTSNRYLKELLEVFSGENWCDETGVTLNQSDEASPSEDAVGEMSANHSQRNIRARIQAFESQGGANEGNAVEPVKPEPRPRKAAVKPPVAAKPSVAVKPQLDHSTDDDSQNVLYTDVPQNPTPAPRPQPPRKPVGMSIKEELESIHSKGGVPNRSRPSVLTRANSIHEEEPSPVPPVPRMKPMKEPLKPNLNINNHNSACVFSEDKYIHSQASAMPVEPQSSVESNAGTLTRQTRRPTTIRVPSKTLSLSEGFQDAPPPLPVQKAVGSMNSSVFHRQNSTPVLPVQGSFGFGPEPSLPPRRVSSTKTLPPRPPPAKAGPGRPPAPSLQASGRSASAPWDASAKPQALTPHRKRPVLPPRPKPGHRLYNKYTLELPHGIAVVDYNGSNTGELSFQKNEVLLLLKDVDHNIFECQVGDIRGKVYKSHVQVITPLASDMSQDSGPGASGGDGYGQRVQVIHDFFPESTGELGLKAGDIVTMVEQVDSEWYRGTCRGASGFFPINYVKVMSDSPKPLPTRKPKPPSATVSGPRCVARFDFEGEHSDELSFSEGDVIRLKEYIGQDWARGQIGNTTGIFPLNFVEVIEDFPPPPGQQQPQPQPQPKSVPLPGMVASPIANTEFAKPAQVSQSSVDWVVARYDYAGKSDADLSFQQGDCILVTQHVNAEWSCGRLNGREGMFPRAFVESNTGQQPFDIQKNKVAVSGRARALYNFTSDCDEELSLQMGDIITNVESVDEEWFLGDLRGRRALVPKNYVQVLG